MIAIVLVIVIMICVILIVAGIRVHVTGAVGGCEAHVAEHACEGSA